ncbi:hypothetical protein [Breoghania sp.]|uniref:hypothetical protein n=1 Tax=Breoghania sp. TaxID=2065378 RepID=UPI00261F0B16|nr:hypothetical protein [Breoghania sp.]MDJ0932814.1 hypothetical protein [Breoghania sp.]
MPTKASITGAQGTPLGGLIGRSMQHKIVLPVCCCVAVSSVVVGAVSYYHVRASAVEKAKQPLTVKAHLMSQRLRNAYSDVARDLKMLAEMPPIQGIIRSSRNGGVDPFDGSTEELWHRRLNTIFQSALSQRPDAFQIRYIGLEDGGRELIRVDRTPSGTEIVKDEELQRKSNEPYFKLGANALPDQVVFSEVTYNREFGRRDPRDIPTIRGILTIYDQLGTRFGMLVINVDYDAMLRNAFAQMRPRKHTFIVNG